MSETAPDIAAGQELAKVCHQVATYTSTERLALMAYIQANMTQCAVQTLVDLLKQKNLFGDVAMQKRLAEMYSDLAKKMWEAQWPSAPQAPAVRS